MELFNLVNYAQWMPEFLTGVAASATVAFFMGALNMRRVYRQRDKAALTQFAREMGRLIDMAHADCTSNSTTPRVIRTEARAIVSVRDSFQNTLSSMKEVLNSNIDRLGKELDALENTSDDKKAQEAVHETIMVLKKTWPAKSIEIEVRLRKLFAELGLKEI